jgi:hypothetical protein
LFGPPQIFEVHLLGNGIEVESRIADITLGNLADLRSYPIDRLIGEVLGFRASSPRENLYQPKPNKLVFLGSTLSIRVKPIE